MRIAVIDENAARAAIIEQGLSEAGETEVFVISERHGLARAIEALDPDVVLIDLGNPSRDMLEEYFAVSRAVARPVAMFVDQSDDESIGNAIEAGVSAYIVDGMTSARIKPILNLAVRRFKAFSRLQNELQQARSELADRDIIEKAKKLLMKKRGLAEPDAHAMLRKYAMNSNKRLADVADAILMAENMLGGE
ncbi:MAG: ANTAR domain-containing protein [Sphingomonadales bacterium]|nr:ANTAR domain-containing protein [Sphingomonadales bacterium]